MCVQFIEEIRKGMLQLYLYARHEKGGGVRNQKRMLHVYGFFCISRSLTSAVSIRILSCKVHQFSIYQIVFMRCKALCSALKCFLMIQKCKHANKWIQYHTHRHCYLFDNILMLFENKCFLNRVSFYIIFWQWFEIVTTEVLQAFMES